MDAAPADVEVTGDEAEDVEAVDVAAEDSAAVAGAVAAATSRPTPEKFSLEA